MELIESVEDFVTTQDYTSRKMISGVEIIELPVFTDDGGLFLEIGRFDDQGTLESPAVKPRQISYSMVLPGAIKAWHLHRKQEDVWFVPPHERLLLGLWDCRKDSDTEDQLSRIVLGGGRGQLVRIPMGVAHGCANLSNAPASIFYFVTQQFDIKDPDELRFKWDTFGKEFWEMEKG